MRDRIKQILREETEPSTYLRRRVDFSNLDNIVDFEKDKNFNKDLDIRNYLIKNTIVSVLYRIMPEDDEYTQDNVIYYELWDKIKAYLYDRYYDELYKYFERRKQGYKD